MPNQFWYPYCGGTGDALGLGEGTATALLGSAMKVPPGNTTKPPLPGPPAKMGNLQVIASPGGFEPEAEPENEGKPPDVESG
jgi:hypothetical protein